MLGKGIPERAILLMRPFMVGGATTGDICSCMATLPDGSVVGSIKEWCWSGRVATLTDGENKKFGLPAGATKLEAVSRWTKHLLTY